MNNREEEKQTQQGDDTANNNDEEQRKQYLQDLQKRVKESRKQPDCFECCFAYWLFILLGFVFRQLFQKVDETPEGCDFIGLIISILLIVFSLSAFCRFIDGFCILIPCKNTSCFHLSLRFHDLNNLINFQTCKWGLIILTIIWLLNYSCIVFWPMFIFLLITWILVLVWKAMENE